MHDVIADSTGLPCTFHARRENSAGPSHADSEWRRRLSIDIHFNNFILVYRIEALFFSLAYVSFSNSLYQLFYASFFYVDVISLKEIKTSKSIILNILKTLSNILKPWNGILNQNFLILITKKYKK